MLAIPCARGMQRRNSGESAETIVITSQTFLTVVAYRLRISAGGYGVRCQHGAPRKRVFNHSLSLCGPPCHIWGAARERSFLLTAGPENRYPCNGQCCPYDGQYCQYGGTYGDYCTCALPEPRHPKLGISCRSELFQLRATSLSRQHVTSSELPRSRVCQRCFTNPPEATALHGCY